MLVTLTAKVDAIALVTAKILRTLRAINVIENKIRAF